MTQPDKNNPDCVAVFSGGLDSTTLVYGLLNSGMTPHLLSFNYGQRHKKELDYAKKTAELLGLRHDIVDLSGITHLISNSALTSSTHQQTETDPSYRLGYSEQPNIEVPEGHYAEDNMKATVVPNRNMIMISIAAGVAVSNNYVGVFVGVHAGDHFVYPDCRPMFIEALGAAIIVGNEGFGKIEKLGSPEGVKPFLFAPYVQMTKEDIAFEALNLQVPLENTWSCYKGGDKHCGKCGTCVERLEAIDGAAKRWDNDHANHVNNVNNYDNTKYEDSEYWKEAIKNG